ncbi:MAG: ABC transporter ATP-binding protein [Aeromonadales bacterium]|nr:ABC transporter ATP-binding protein [Aeromonadales bacterium]
MFNAFRALISFIKNDKNKETQIKWSLYIRVWKEFGLPFWKLLALAIFCTTLATSAEGYAITLVQKIIDKGFIEKNMDYLYMIGLQLIGAYIVKSIFSYTRTISIARVGFLGACSLRKRLFRHMVYLSQDFFQQVQTGPIMNGFTGLANMMLAMVTTSVMGMIQNIVSLIIMVGLMFWYAPQITATLFILGPAIAAVVTIIARRRRAVARKRFMYDAASMSQITEDILGIKTIQAFGTEEYEYRKICGIEDNRVKTGMKSASLTGIQSPVLEVMISIGLCGALIVGGHFITEGDLSTGDFTAFLLAMTAAYKPVKGLTNVSGGIQEGLVAAESLFDMFDHRQVIEDASNAVALRRGPMQVSFNDIHFFYNPNEGEVIRGLSLDVKPGQICAFVGKSGGGKSTMFNLLLRFFDPQQGCIKINGIDIRHYTLKTLRGSMALVSQDVFLFDDTIYENIKYGVPKATREQVMKAAEAAEAAEFINSFPEKYDMRVGERGMLLSGGQKQRIAIARAILRNAPILLLDEATSALDSNSEALIQKALKKLMKGRTVFVIAHRLSTVLDSDVICFIKDGMITEKGTDAELVALNGDYRKLRDLQFNQTIRM